MEESAISGPDIMRDAGLYRQRWHYFMSQKPENVPVWMLVRIVRASGLPIQRVWDIIEDSSPTE